MGSNALTCKELLRVADSERSGALFIDRGWRGWGGGGDLQLHSPTMDFLFIEMKLFRHGGPTSGGTRRPTPPPSAVEAQTLQSEQTQLRASVPDCAGTASVSVVLFSPAGAQKSSGLEFF